MTPVGAVIMSIFAAIWWVVGTRLSGNGSVPMYAVPAVITTAILVLAMRRRTEAKSRTPEEEARQGRVIGYASAAEGVAILVAVNVLGNIGKSDWDAPAVAIIVGLHFLPIARWLPVRFYYLPAALLAAVGLGGLGVPDMAFRLLFVSVAAAVVLWLTCAVVLGMTRVRPERSGV